MLYRAKGNLYTAVDVGTTQTRVLVARVDTSGKLDIVAGGTSASRGVKKGMVVSLNEAKEAIREAVQEARSDLGRRLPAAWVGVTGSHMQCHNASASLDLSDSEQPISHQDLALAVQSSVPEMVPKQQVLHVIPQSYALDGLRSARKPVGLHGRRLDVESHVVLADSSPLDNVISAVRSAGLGVRALVLESLASSASVLTADERERGVVLVDMGGGTSDVALFYQGAICYTAVVPVGGYQFTNDLCLALGVPFHTAEEVKLRYGHAISEGIDPKETVEFPEPELDDIRRVPRREVCRHLNARSTELVRLVLHHLHRAGLTRLPTGGMVLTGGTAKLAGLVDLVRDITGAPARVGVPRDILGLPKGMSDPCFATSVGLLLWSINPQEERLRHTARPGVSSWLHRWARWFPHLIPARGNSAS